MDDVIVRGLQNMDEGNKKNKTKKIFMISGIFLLVLLLIFAWLGFTRSGRRVIYRIAGGLIHKGLDTDEDIEASSVIIPYEKNTKKNEKNKAQAKEKETNNDDQVVKEEVIVPRIKPDPRIEDYVTNFLLFGLEANNADTIMIASVNTRDSTIKLTSLLRDTYIDMEGFNPNKLNAFFSLGGAKTFVDVVEDKYRIKIDGYAYLNFESFEKIIDYLGGFSFELGEKEA